jgi:mannose-1-phosphate guanylyltransferase
MKIFAVIMAGGVGSRFWPRSKEKTPKQLLKIFGSQTMIQATVARLNGIVEKENIYVITNKIQRPEIVRQLDGVPAENIIEEPFGRNTAACIGLASAIIEKKDSDAVTIILPADHIIKETEKFHTTLKSAAEFAYKSKGLVTIGIVPTRPETGYGYIQIDENETEPNIHKVYTFAEKPNYATAVRFLDSGDFLWNSGMFIWSVKTIMDLYRDHAPDIYKLLIRYDGAIGTPDESKVFDEIYDAFPSISVDYAILEHAPNITVIPASIGWSDLGSWSSLYEIMEKDDNGNAVVGDHVGVDTHNCLIHSERLVATVGLDNMVVVDTGDAVLILPSGRSQDIKALLDELKKQAKTKYL